MLRFRTVRQTLPLAPVSLPAQTPVGVRIYAFGDVHGRADLLQKLFAAIHADAIEAPSGARVTVVGLGDYIDRAGDPKRAIQMLLDGMRGLELVWLRGNHEQMLLDFLEDPDRNGRRWLANGAADTLRSYGIELKPAAQIRREELRRLRDALARALPPAHLLFLQGLPLSFTSGDYFFTHAGIRADVASEQQTPHDLLWIREGFADRDEPTDKVVVHGHTSVPEPYIGRYRINLDTGAYFTNHLACLVLDGSQQTLLKLADA